MLIMKRLIMFLGILVLLFVIGCSTFIEQVPDQYTDNSFSIKGFLAVKDNYENESINLRGIVESKGECPLCPKGHLCEPCFDDYIVLVDSTNDVTIEGQIWINFFKDKEIFQNLKLGEKIIINVKYNSKSQGGMFNNNGYFAYNSLTKI